MDANILKRLFFDENQHWESFKRKHGRKISPIVIKEVAKFRDCGNPKNGFKLVCEGCHDVRKVLIAVKDVSAQRVLLVRVKSEAAF